MSESRPWFLKDSGFMQQVEPADRDVFLDVCPERVYRAGEFVFRMGDPADKLHIIARGKVKLVRPTATGHDRMIAVCGPDDFIGEAFLREADSYRLDAIAMSDVTTCPISREQFRVVVARAPGFALTLTEVLVSHLSHCREQLSSSYDVVKVRVAKILLEHVVRFGGPHALPGWRSVDTELKHEDIASLASASRVAVTMAITELREDGALRGTRGHYELDVSRLEAMADGLE